MLIRNWNEYIQNEDHSSISIDSMAIDFIERVQQCNYYLKYSSEALWIHNTRYFEHRKQVYCK